MTGGSFWRIPRSHRRAIAVVLLWSYLAPPALLAHSEVIHARMVVEAQKFIEQEAAYAQLRDFLEDAGWVEASAPVKDLVQRCTLAARSPTYTSPKVNLLAREACRVDFYRDMYVDIFPGDIADIGVQLSNVGTDLSQFLDDLSKAEGSCLRIDHSFTGLLEAPAKCAAATFAALWSGALDVGGSLAFLWETPWQLGGKFFAEAFGANFTISHIGTLFNFTSFNHLMHVEPHAWEGQNDAPGYSIPHDPARLTEVINKTTFLSWGEMTAGRFAADAMNAEVNYGESDALQRYRLNNSGLTAADFRHKLVTEAEYEPLDNLGSYGMNKAIESQDMTKLGRPLHAAGDATHPFHVIGNGGPGEHQDYEEYVRSHWESKRDQWIDYPTIRHYLADSRLSPNRTAAEIITAAAEMSHEIGGDKTDDSKHREKFGIGIAAIINLLEVYRRAASNTQSPPTTTGRYPNPRSAPFFSSYPYPESAHKRADQKAFGEYFWFQGEADMHGKSRCSKLHVDFSHKTSGTSGETLTVFRYADVGNPAMVFVERFTMKDLENHSIELKDAAGFMIRYERSANVNPGWGFRVTKITCS